MWGGPKIVPQNRLSSAPPEPPSFQWWRWWWTNRRFNPLNVLIFSQRDGQKREKGLLYTYSGQRRCARADRFGYNSSILPTSLEHTLPSPATFYSTHGNAVPHSSFFPPFWKRKKIHRQKSWAEQNKRRKTSNTTASTRKKERKERKLTQSPRWPLAGSLIFLSVCLPVCVISIFPSSFFLSSSPPSSNRVCRLNKSTVSLLSRSLLSLLLPLPAG